MVHCSINGCNASNDKRLNRVKRDPDLKNVHFYRFPRKSINRKAWETVCARHGKFNTKNAYICSKHFKPDDYARNLKHELLNYCPKNSKKLKADAIPTVNIPSAIRVGEQPGKSEVNALSTSLPNLEPTNFMQPKIKVKSRQKLGVTKIKTVTESEENLGIKVGPDPITADNPSHRKGDASLASKTSKETQLKNSCNSEPPSTDRWQKVPFAIENSTQRNGDVCLAYFIPPGLSQKIPRPISRRSVWNLETPGTSRWHKVQLQFLNHVIMIWVNRGRKGNPNIVMLDSMLKAKAREAAAILNTFINSTFGWLQSFKEKLQKEDVRHPPQYGPKQSGLSMNIADIIEDEWLRYRCKDSDISFDEIELNPSKEIQVHETIVPKAFVPPSIVDWESPIESYLEALDCLTMVETYALSTRNFRAVGVITDLENLLTLECQ